MDQDEHLSLNEFQLYDSITNGSLRPHLPDNNDVKRITRLYQEEVWDVLGQSSEKVEFLNLVLNNPYYIRYRNVLMQKGDEAIWELHDDGKTYLKLPHNTDNLINLDIPLPTGVISAYYLFIIEREFDRISNKFQQVLTNGNWRTFDLKNYSNRNLLLLKRLAEQAHIYENQLSNAGHHDTFSDTSPYVLWVIKEYILRSILILQEVFEPYLKVKLLNEFKIRVKYFEYAQRMSEMELEMQMLADNKGADIKEGDSKGRKKDTENTSFTWHQLFKGSTEDKQKEAANKIINILRNEKYITEDGSWKKNPHQLTMIALYLVLEDRGYLKEAPISAEELSSTFNKQFHMNFTSRKWRPGSRADAESYMELFNLIPTHSPQDYSS